MYLLCFQLNSKFYFLESWEKLCCQWHERLAQDLCTLELHSSGARLMVLRTLVVAPCGLLAPAAVRRCECAEHLLPHWMGVCSRVASWAHNWEGCWVGSRNLPFSCHLGEPACAPLPLNQKTYLVFLEVSPVWYRRLLALCPLPGPLTAWCRPYMKVTTTHSLTSINQHYKMIAQDKK